MDNTAIDLRAFEMKIRADERAKVKHEIRMRRIEKMAQRRKRVALMKQYAIQRVMGLVLVVGSIILATSGWTYDIEMQANDGTFLLLTVPLGLYLLFTKELCLYQ